MLPTNFLRAGGGSGGGGSGGGGGGGGGFRIGRRFNFDFENPLDIIIVIIAIIISLLGGGGVYVQTVYEGKKNSKKLMKMLSKKDSAWKYKDLQKYVRNAYFLIQQSWTELDMTPAKYVMSEELFNDYQEQLKQMRYKHKRSVLEKIKLIEAVPVSVYDNDDDDLDFVWFFIHGKMIDYTIDTYTKEMLDGKKSETEFGEYWKFDRTKDGSWVLEKILQKNQSDLITFTR